MGVILPDLSQVPDLDDGSFALFDNGVVSYTKTLGIIKAYINSGRASQADLQALSDAYDLSVIQLANLIVKQENEKLVQAVMVNRTFKGTSGNADITASDAPTTGSTPINTWVDRDLNYAKVTPNSAGVFVPQVLSKRLQILQPGSYEVFFETHLRQANYCAVMVEYRPPTGSYLFKQIKDRTATGATTAGNESHVASSKILDIPPGLENGHLYLSQWSETNTSNNRYGLWYCRGTGDAPYNYVDTCTLRVTKIS